MKVLVTGSSGFIGQHVCETLLEAGHDIYGLDLVPPKKDSREQGFHKCDLLDKDQTKNVVRSCKPDVVVHLAARTDLAEKTNIEGYAVNNIGALNLIEAVTGVNSVQRCIFTSTQLVCRVGHVPSSDHDFCPSTLYGESKVLMEKAIREQRGGVSGWCIVRPTTVWGPGMSGHYQRFFRMVQQGRYFHVGWKPLWKSYGYVGNIAYQFGKLIEAPLDRIHQKVFYLADYEPISLRSWADGLQRAFGARSISTVPERLAKLAGTAGDAINYLGFRNFPFNSFRLNNILTEYQFDLAETERICGSLPCTMEQGIAETVRWIQASERYLRPG